MKTMIDLETYLKQPGFMRLWPIVRDKYIQLSRIGGSVTLRRISDEERDALSGLLVKNFYGKSQVSVSLNLLDASLRATRFEASLEHCLEILYPDTLRTRIDALHAGEVRWQNFCRFALGTHVAVSASSRQATDAQAKARLSNWIRTLTHRNGLGYRTFLECYEEFCANGSRNLSLSWTLAISALSCLPVEAERLPIFAARITGDAHGLDRDRLVGRMFYYGIRMLHSGMEDGVDGGMAADSEAEGEYDTESLRALYQQAGILLDDVSSLVLVAGWRGISEQPVALPLCTVEQVVSTGLLVGATTPIYVVENPSIFSAVIDTFSQGGKSLPYPLVCTSGQPSLAALRLLDFARDGGAKIFYSGDFDVKGLQIAYQLKSRYSDSLDLWRMDGESYAQGLHPYAPKLSETELSQLGKILQEDGKLYVAMQEHRRKVYQEHLVGIILRDYGEGNTPFRHSCRWTARKI